MANKTTDIQLVVDPAKITKIQQLVQEKRRIAGKVGTYEFKGARRYLGDRNVVFSQPPYDLQEIARASDVEPYINQSIKKHREKILKEGYTLYGQDEEMVEYIKKRLFEISIVTDCSTEEWVRQLTLNLVTYHTAFIVFKRDKSRSTGGIIRKFGKNLQPIAGIFIPDSSSMEVCVDKYGVPIKWKQNVESLNFGTSVTKKNNEFNIEDVIVITMDKKSGFTFGTPYILPVLDDIRALRKLEELTVILASKEAFPLYHYKVGTPEKPAIRHLDNTSEVDTAIAQISSMPAQGFIVTSERYSIELVSRAGAALDLGPYLKYFEARVLAGLRLSELDLGRGGAASKGTASNIDKNLEDAAKDYQKVISDALTLKLLLPLALEGGYNVSYDNLVKFEFPMIDREEFRLRQTHGLALFQAGVISLDEYRKEYLNKKPLDPSEIMKTDTAIRTAIAAYFAPILNPPSPTSGSSSSSASKPSTPAVSNKVSNIIQPENQYGRLPTKRRVTANDKFKQDKAQLDEFISNLTLKVTDLLNKKEVVDEDIADIKTEYSSFISDYLESNKEHIVARIRDGWEEGISNYEKINNKKISDIEDIGNRQIDKFNKGFIIKSFWATGGPILDNIFLYLNRDKSNNPHVHTLHKNINYLHSTLIKLIIDQDTVSFRYGFSLLAKRTGYKKVNILNKINNSQNNIDISNLQYKNLLPNSLDEIIEIDKNNG